ncbi:MAG: extracellular matrix regulator RemB [Thermincolia bacterium]
MFLHLGGDVIVFKNDIIAIIDLKNIKRNDAIKEFLQVAEQEGFVKYITEKGNEKSFILTTKNVYLSAISSNTLKKRSDNIKYMNNA